MAKRLSLNEIKAAFQKKGLTLLSDSYKNSSAELQYLCPKGHTGITSWDRLKRGLGCAECAGNKKLSRAKIEQIFSEEGYSLLSTYLGAHVSVEYLCPSGHRHSVRVYHFISGVRCPDCYQLNNKRRLSFEYVKQFFESEKYRLLTTSYKNKETLLHYECPRGHQHYTKWIHFRNGHRCPTCNESKGEKTIAQVLSSLSIKFRRQYKLEEGRSLRLDFYIPTFSIAIEYDGLHHFEPVCFGGISLQKARILLKKQKENDQKRICYVN